VAWRNHREKGRGRASWIRANEPLLETLLFGLLVLRGSSLLKYDAAFFVAGELVRFACAFALLILPALLLGLGFPLLLNLYADDARRAGTGVGGIYAANTFGAIAGSVVTGFVVIPRLGSLSTMRSLGGVNILLAVAFAIFLLRSSRSVKLAFAAF